MVLSRLGRCIRHCSSHLDVDYPPLCLWRGRLSTTLSIVLVETDNLIDSTVVAAIVGLGNSRAVSTYRGRYSDFPPPVVDMGAGRCLLWLRSDIEAWSKGRGKIA